MITSFLGMAMIQIMAPTDHIAILFLYLLVYKDTIQILSLFNGELRYREVDDVPLISIAINHCYFLISSFVRSIINIISWLMWKKWISHPMFISNFAILFLETRKSRNKKVQWSENFDFNQTCIRDISTPCIGILWEDFLKKFETRVDKIYLWDVECINTWNEVSESRSTLYKLRSSNESVSYKVVWTCPI